jgi:diguanylate cyclase (GGDEF)-like protein
MTESSDMAEPLQVLAIDDPQLPLEAVLATLQSPRWGPFTVVRCTHRSQAAQMLSEQAFDAVLVALEDAPDDRLPMWPGMSQATLQAGVVFIAPTLTAARALRLLTAGAQDALPVTDCQGEVLARTVQLAAQRHALQRSARKAYASDLATGLPNHQQLIEHMSQLIALRQRQPALMALLVLRVEGFGSVQAVLGVEGANVLRRKVAVRLRAGVRSSDVVAALGDDAYAVLLASIVELEHAAGVGAKLLDAVRDPFSVAGRDVALAVGLGVALYPDHGDDAEVLVRRAMGLAASSAAVGRGGFVSPREGGSSMPLAANHGEDEAA